MKKTTFYLIFFIVFSLFFSCKSPEVVPYTSFNYSFHQEQIKLTAQKEGFFTMAVIPDIQEYTLYRNQTDYNPKFPMNYHEILDRQMQFVADNSVKNGGPIAFAAFLGDIVSKRNEYPVEWKYAENAISRLDGLMPFGVVIGNHDYDKWSRKKKKDPWQVSGTECFVNHFGPESSHFKNKEWYKETSHNELNSCIIFKAGGMDFLFLGLEFEPSDESIEWAQAMLEKYSNIPCIIATHGFLRLEKEKGSGNNRFIKLKNHPKGEGNSGGVVWNRLVKPNKNIVLVLCGHVFDNYEGEGMRVDLNEAGYKVYSLLSNYQGRGDLFKAYGFEGTAEVSGDGFMRLMNFDLKRKIIHVQTYSTEFNTFEIDADSDFLLDISDWENRF